MKKRNIIGLLAFMASPQWALGEGTWITGGGQLLTHENNPWFLQNKETIRYCILHDPQAFSADKDSVDSTFREAFAYWKRDFARMGAIGAGTGAGQIQVELATQTLLQQTCDDPVDLMVLAGALPGGNKPKEFETLQQYFGMTMRTDYDMTRLQGRGYIFLGPDRGWLGRKFPNPEGMWSREKTLLHGLVHELGHVFGLPHSNQDSSSLMNEHYLDSIAGNPPTLAPSSFLFGHLANGWDDTSYVACFREDTPLFRFFGAPGGSQCFSHRFDGARIKIFVGLAHADVRQLQEIGHAEVTLEPGCQEESAGWLYLPKEQTVFSGVDPMASHSSRRFLIIRRKLSCLSGNYESNDGRVRRPFGLSGVSLNVFPPRFSGVLDGVFINNLFRKSDRP